MKHGKDYWKKKWWMKRALLLKHFIFNGKIAILDEDSLRQGTMEEIVQNLQYMMKVYDVL